jgi:hypothetical protein
MAREPRRRRRGSRWLIGLLIVLALVWCGYWYAASRAAEAGFNRFVEAFTAQGGSVACTEQGIGGFPLRLDLRCAGAKLSAQPANLAAGMNRLSASAPLYYPGRVVADFVGPFVLNAQQVGVALTASWLLATATVDIGLNGLSRAGASLDGLALDQTGGRVPIRHLAASHIDFDAAPAGGGDYRITAVARDIAVVKSDGQTYPVVAAQLDVTAVHFGSGFGTDPKRTILAWAAGGGVMQVKTLAFTAGAFSATATGRLTIDRNGLLSGDLTLSLAGLDDLPDIAEQVRPGSRNKVSEAVAFVKPAGNGASPPIPVRINNGAVFVGGIFKVGSIPPLKL